MGRSVLAGFAVALITAATVGAHAPSAAGAGGGSTYPAALPGLSKAQRAALRSLFATTPTTRFTPASRTAREIGAPRAAAIAVRPFPDEHPLAASLLHVSSPTVPHGDYWVVALTTQDARYTGGPPPASSTTKITGPAYCYALVDAGAEIARTFVVHCGPFP